MPVAAAVILIPLSVVIYTVAGGLKATFTSSYLHTVRLPFLLLPVTGCLYTCAHMCTTWSQRGCKTHVHVNHILPSQQES